MEQLINKENNINFSNKQSNIDTNKNSMIFFNKGNFFSFGKDAMVLEPQSLVKKFSSDYNEALQQYDI